MKRAVEGVVDRWLAAYAGQGLEARFRAELALDFAFFQALIFALFALAEMAAGTAAMSYLHLFAQLPLLLCLVALRRGLSIDRIGLVLNANLYLVILTVIVLTAGRGVGALIALPAFVLVALLFSSAMQGAIWLLMAVLAGGLAQWLKASSFAPWIRPDEQWLQDAVYRVPLLISVAVALIALTVRRAMQRYRQVLKTSRAEEHSAQSQASASAQRFASFADLSSDGFWETDAELRVSFVSPSFIRNLGADAERVLGSTLDQLFRRMSSTEGDATDPMGPLSRRESFRDVIVSLPRADRDSIWLRCQGQPVFTSDGAFLGYRGAVHDISQSRQTEQSLRDAETRLRTITDNIPALISYIDTDRLFRFNNQTYAQWLNRPLSEISGKSLTEVYDGPTYARIRPFLDRAFAGEEVSFELEPSRMRDRHLRVTYVPHVAAGGRVIGVYGLKHDVTRFKEVERQLRALSQLDGLTQLANRRYYDERLGQALEASDRRGRALALLFLDLDRFKTLNDRFGHEAGDLALCEFARRLKCCVRQTDTVARLGGDEFVIILENVGSVSAAIAVAQKILEVMKPPLALPQGDWDWSTSIGIAFRDSPEMDEEALLRAADKALYAAKAAGRARYALADSAGDGVAQARAS